MLLLGISAFYHDSAAAIIRDGEIVAAAQEERFTRKKDDSRFPKKAIAYCLREAGIASVDALDYVCFYDSPWLKFERILQTFLEYARLHRGHHTHDPHAATARRATHLVAVRPDGGARRRWTHAAGPPRVRERAPRDCGAPALAGANRGVFGAEPRVVPWRVVVPVGGFVRAIRTTAIAKTVDRKAASYWTAYTSEATMTEGRPSGRVSASIAPVLFLLRRRRLAPALLLSVILALSFLLAGKVDVLAPLIYTLF